MAFDRISLRDEVGGFAPGEPLRAALLLTYCFDGVYLEEAIVPELFSRVVNTALVIRDRHAVQKEALTVRYDRADALFSQRVFHPKLMLLVAQDRALAIIGSANLTRGGIERNMELAMRFELSLDDGSPRQLFESIAKYLAGPLRREVRGQALRDLDDTAVALREVIAHSPRPDKPTPHFFLHNYDQSLWRQVLRKLPTRRLRRVLILSPFYEPDSASFVEEDPTVDESGKSIIHSLFEDFEFAPRNGERPISFYFHDPGAYCALPIDKLLAKRDIISLHAQSNSGTDVRRLHAKLMLFESAADSNAGPFVAVLSGSPNFSAAALLETVPQGNSEIAVLTLMEGPRAKWKAVIDGLGLPDLFYEIKDWSGLPRQTPRRPPPNRGAFQVTEALLRMQDRILEITMEGVPEAGCRVTVMACRDGVWTLIGTVPWARIQPVTLPGDLLVEADAGGILRLTANRVRVEVSAANSDAVAVGEAPLNVDCPEQFCGLALTGPLLMTFDERIARTGAGTPLTYREQKKLLDEVVSRRSSTAAKGPAVSSHQADLDRLYRNLQIGVRGIQGRLAATPNSEFSVRRALRDVTRWCDELTNDQGNSYAPECQYYIANRLVRLLGLVIDTAKQAPFEPRFAHIVADSDVDATCARVDSWLNQLPLKGMPAHTRALRRELSCLRNVLIHHDETSHD